ncbi:DUF885 domain-containing protein [Streptomyces sp. NPDC051018]|uniref:DUF885 domain-containing protein n=1 Tax=Streptomyces sp. NPDC051018 TaxID=3365639 RepID=UPI00379E9C2F
MVQRHQQAELDDLAGEYFAGEMAYDPFAASLLGVTGYAHQVPDPSREAAEKHRSRLRALGERLAALPSGGLTGEARISHRVLTALIRGGEDEIRYALDDVAVSAGVTSPQAQVLQALAMTPVDEEGPAAFLDRLAALPGYFDATLDRYLSAAGQGRWPVRSGVESAIAQLDDYLAGELPADPLVRPVRGHQAEERARALVGDAVRPALARFREGLASGLLEHARPDGHVGVCHVPGGAEGYADALARHTRPGLGAEEIHRIGLEAVAALREEFAELGGRVLGAATADEALAALREDPSLRFGTSAEIVALVEDALERAREAVPGWFRTYEIAGCVTREVDPLEAETAPLAYYQPPGPGDRPGTHWINTLRPGTRFRYEYEALAFHESIPGHHLQIALAQTLTELPPFRRKAVRMTAHVEGWGLYTERLADEMGLYSSDIARFGMLSLDAVRACRLVVDTGMHHLGWSREKAVAYMRDNTATTEANVRNEIDRYIAWPGQATAYLIGRREILRQRERARRELGARFDIKDFHHEVIGHGNLPLAVLDDLVTDWIATAG